MRKFYILLTLLALLLQTTQLHAVEWFKATGGKQGPDGKYFYSQEEKDYVELPYGTEYCRIYQLGSNNIPNHTNFPDGTLRYRIANAVGYKSGGQSYGTCPFDYTGWNKQYDLYITKAQAKALTSLNISAGTGSKISVLTGIEIFENLTSLDVSGNNLGSGTVPLDILYPKVNGSYDYDSPYHPYAGINHNELSGTYQYTDPISGDITIRDYKYRYLGYFLRFFRHLKTVNCSNCNLQELYCGGTDATHVDELETIDASNNISLFRLNINYSNTQTLNITGCTNLATLEAAHSNLSTLDVSTNLNLQTLYAPYNPNLTSITHANTGEYEYLKCMDFRDCDLTQIDHLELCPALEILKCQNNKITTLDLHDDVALKQVYCSNNYLTTLDLSDNALIRLECRNNRLTSLDVSGSSNNTLTYLDCSGNSTLSNLDVTHNTALQTLYCYSDNISTLDLSNNTNLVKLRISNNPISVIDLSNNNYLEDFYCNNCSISSLSFTNLTALKVLQMSRNRLTELNLTPCTQLETLFCESQGGDNARLLRVLKLNSSALTTLRCDNNSLLSLDLSNCPNLVYTGVLSATQRAEQDLVVLDHNKVCIELPNGAAGYGDANDDPVNYFHTWDNSGWDVACSDVIYRNNKYWLAIYNIEEGSEYGISTKADVDFYNKNISYIYDLWYNEAEIHDGTNLKEGLGKSTVYSSGNDTIVANTSIKGNSDRKNANITVKVYPYVMYINPASADNYSLNDANPGSPFYSGTIYLDYDAIVPAGTTAYIAKSILIQKDKIYRTADGGQLKVTADQLELVPLVPGEGATEVVIPALTPVYVKSDTENGLFSFDRNNHGGVEQALGVANDGSDLTEDNILRGTLENLTVEKHSVLTLGRSRRIGTDVYTNEARIGFWPYNGTTISAHRVYIPMSELENAGVNTSSSPGLLFSFSNDDSTTGLRSVTIDKAEGWYTIGGIRLKARPTEKGVYIHNGRKEVIR